MRRTARNALHDAGTVIDDIDRPDTPTVIVAVLAVVHTDLPPITIAGTPPFAGYIMVPQTPVGNGTRAGITRFTIYRIGHQDRIDGSAGSYTRYNCRTALVILERFAEDTEIDTVAGIITASDSPRTCTPFRRTLP